MTDFAPLPDWTSLGQSQRAAAARVCRRRTESLGVRLNAVASMLPDAGHAAGPLAGLPYVAKDLFATGVHAASNGLADNGKPPAPRAAALLRFDRAGASLIAAAEMTALAYEPSGHNAGRGRVLNPWDFDAISGGSSSGSAALVAAGCAFAALGTDTGGSVRIPASCCGVTGLKPTFNAVPAAGSMALAPSLDTIGLFARSARDLALIWPIVSGRAGQPAPKTTIRAVRLNRFFDDSTPVVRRVCDTALDVLSHIGFITSGADGFPEDADALSLTIMQAEAALMHGNLPDDVDPMLRRRIGKGRDISADALSEGLSRRDRLRRQFLENSLGDADVALTPVLPIAVPDAAETDPATPAFRPRTLYALSRFTRFVNVLGLPALSIPAGFDDRGRPVGLQLIGRPDAEALLLTIGAAFQDFTTWHALVPAAVAVAILSEGEAAA